MSEMLLMCLIAGKRAAIPARLVQSVIELEEITPVPLTPDYVLGLTALRSQALTVIDCRSALGLGPTPRTEGARAAVVSHDGHSYALLVDQAREVDAAQSDVAPVPGGFGGEWHRAAEGLVETASGPALVMSIERLIEGPQDLAA